MNQPPATTSRLGQLSAPLASTREYDLCMQEVRVKADEPTCETMYSIVHRANSVVEGRFPNYPAALTAMMQFESSLNEVRIAASNTVTFHG